MIFFAAYIMAAALVFVSHQFYEKHFKGSKPSPLILWWCLFVILGFITTLFHIRDGITDFLIGLGFYGGILVMNAIITIVRILRQQ